MTHYDVDYTSLEGEAKKAKAIADIKFYLGEEKFNSVTQAGKKDLLLGRLTKEQFAWMCRILAGIDGYPITVWWELIKN